MVNRKIAISESAAESIAAIAWYIESKGMVATAEKFADAVYDFFEKLSNSMVTHALCRDRKRAILGLKCVPYKKKYTVVFWEPEEELVVHEFVLSKQIH
jgi:plasmid stabilization system protein ParE